jgi:hypothetical protein
MRDFSDDDNLFKIPATVIARTAVRALHRSKNQPSQPQLDRTPVRSSLLTFGLMDV